MFVKYLFNCTLFIALIDSFPVKNNFFVQIVLSLQNGCHLASGWTHFPMKYLGERVIQINYITVN